MTKTEIFKQLARPFTIYASTVTVCALAFLGKPVDAMLVVAGLGGANAAMRSFDKKLTPVA